MTTATAKHRRHRHDASRVWLRVRLLPEERTAVDILLARHAWTLRDFIRHATERIGRMPPSARPNGADTSNSDSDEPES